MNLDESKQRTLDLEVEILNYKHSNQFYLKFWSEHTDIVQHQMLEIDAKLLAEELGLEIQVMDENDFWNKETLNS